jgi:hypothetical protein
MLRFVAGDCYERICIRSVRTWSANGSDFASSQSCMTRCKWSTCNVSCMGAHVLRHHNIVFICHSMAARLSGTNIQDTNANEMQTSMLRPGTCKFFIVR